MKLVPIEMDGTIDADFHLSALAFEMCQANKENFDRVGYVKPWTAYLAVSGRNVVGTCAFKSPPRNNRVEIAYFTFPECEGRGVATAMAKELLGIARKTQPTIQVFAQTLAEDNASTSILSNLNFEKVREFTHPEDGLVWEWEHRYIAKNV